MDYQDELKKALGICITQESFGTGDAIDSAQRELQGYLTYLEACRVFYHAKHTKRMHELIEKKIPVSKAQVYADVDYPQLYELRRIITRCDKVSEVLRSTLSGLKNEFLNHKNN